MPSLSTLHSREPRSDAGDRETSYLHDADEIAAILRVLRDQRADLSLRFDDSGEAIHARVLDVADEEFLIEDIRPREGAEHLIPERIFSAAARIRGLYAFADQIRIISREAERGLPFYRVSLPESLLVQQRRRAARFRIPMRVSTRGAKVLLHREDTLRGKLIDISAGGLSAEFIAPVNPPTENEVIEQCEIEIPNLLSLTSKAVVRHRALRRRGRLVCGIELTEMAVADRRHLEQFIHSLAKISEQR